MNVLTVCNEQYTTYIIPFIKSLENTDLSPARLFIVDAGLSDATLKRLHNWRDWCDTLTDLVVIPSAINVVNAPVHSPEWRKIVALKLENAKKLLESKVLPLLIIDIDCIFVRPLLDDLASIETDVSVCGMSKPFTNADGHYLEYIACMMYFKTSKALIFVDNVLRIMSSIKGAHIETPSVNRELSAQASVNWPLYKCTKLPESEYCSPIWSTTAKTLHFRSHGTSKDILQRIAYVLYFSDEFDYLFDVDLNTYRKLIEKDIVESRIKTPPHKPKLIRRGDLAIKPYYK